MDNPFFIALWAFPAIICAAIIIAWAAECSQFMISQGLALAVLAWLQTLPEFAVEAVIAFEAGKDIAKTHLITANFTGSLRLLVGLGWPMIFFTQFFFGLKNNSARTLSVIKLDRLQAVNVAGLALPLIYFIVIILKRTLSVVDGGILIGFYALYLIVLNKLPPEEAESCEMAGRIPKKIIRMANKKHKITIITSLFAAGGVILFFSAEPFLHSMLGIAAALGISQFIFVQWIAPFLSEFPEKVSAFYWAKSCNKAPMALMNMVSSNINQWTVLVGMVPFIFAFSLGRNEAIHFDNFQIEEIILTVIQSALGMLFLFKMRITLFEISGLFILWLAQFVMPSLRQEITYVYSAWLAVEIIAGIIKPARLQVFPTLAQIAREYLLKV